MLVWLTLPFYDFCGFRSVAVNSVYKLQFFTFITNNGYGAEDSLNVPRTHIYEVHAVRVEVKRRWTHISPTLLTVKQ